MTPPGHCRLILTRHAKSDWDDPSLPDQDIPAITAVEGIIVQASS